MGPDSPDIKPVKDPMAPVPPDPIRPDPTNASPFPDAPGRDPMNVTPEQAHPDAINSPADTISHRQPQPPETERPDEGLSAAQQENLQNMAGSPEALAQSLASQNLSQEQVRNAIRRVYPKEKVSDAEVDQILNSEETQNIFRDRQPQREQEEAEDAGEDIDPQQYAEDPQVQELKNEINYRLSDPKPMKEEEKNFPLEKSAR